MIRQATSTVHDTSSASAEEAAPSLVLARYGAIPVVARFDIGECEVTRGQQLVVETDRGEELAEVLEFIPTHLSSNADSAGRVLRVATADDRSRAADASRACEEAFEGWLRRCEEWKLQLELVDIEQTLDEKLILYVLNDRGPETTRLALLAAAGGHGVIHVQPVNAEGVDPVKDSGGGCGSQGGCGCSH